MITFTRLLFPFKMKGKNVYSSSCILKCSICHNEFKSQRSLSNHLSFNPACASKKRKKMSPLGNRYISDSTFKKDYSGNDDKNYKSYDNVTTSSTSMNAMNDHLNGNSVFANVHSDHSNGTNDDNEHNDHDMRNIPDINDPNFF